MKVRFTATALAELDRIAQYIARDNPAAAATIVSRVEQLTDRLAEFPQMAYATDEEGVRVVPVGPLSVSDLLDGERRRGDRAARPPCGPAAAVKIYSDPDLR